MPAISIIVPVYRAEKYLHRCVDSILSQTFSDFEVLLIDDGSPDKSGQICDEYAKKDSRIRVFHKENGGVSSARNVGLNNATGLWVGFVDSDDWIGEEYLSAIMKIKEDVDVVHFGYQKEVSFSKYKKYFIFIPQYITKTECLSPTIFSSGCYTYFFKLTLLRENGIVFNKNVKYSEDREFIIKALLKTNKNIFITTNVEYRYAYNVSSAVHQTRNYMNLFDDIYVLRNIHDFVKTENIQMDSQEQNFINQLLLNSFIYVYSTQAKDTPFYEIRQTIEEILDGSIAISEDKQYNKFLRYHKLYALYWNLRSKIKRILMRYN